MYLDLEEQIHINIPYTRDYEPSLSNTLHVWRGTRILQQIE